MFKPTRLFRRSGNRAATASGGSLLDHLCRENGWEPDERHGDGIVLYFDGDARTRQRSVIIVHPTGEHAVFDCPCCARFEARSMAAATVALFPARNKESLYGKWMITIDDGEVTPHCRYTALVGGLDAKIFKAICVGLLAEVAFVEEVLHGQGLL